ncbi:MAG TPA: AAA family ATPase [Gaiellaceae bacterium]|nr:AAA family ATPase [Gaiellaceae bacterium]
MAELLERDELLAQLEELRRAGGHLVFVGGEAGAGKSSLLRAFARRAGGRVLVGGCESLTTPTPYGPLLDLGLDVTAAGEPRLVAHALLDRLREPTTLVLEDVHWADEATLDVLRVLGRRIEASPSLVVATYRDDEAVGEHPLRVVLGELATAPAVARVAVPRLTEDGVRQLALPFGVDAAELHRLTLGNAFYVTEALAAGAATLPETVRDAVLARVARLSPTARRLIDAVSVVPTAAELWLLEAIAADALSAADECLRAGVLRPEPAALAFRHELARLAVESALSPHRRRELHAATLHALARPPSGTPSSARLAHHAEAAGDAAAVLEHATAAAREAAARGARREATRQYARSARAYWRSRAHCRRTGDASSTRQRWTRSRGLRAAPPAPRASRITRRPPATRQPCSSTRRRLRARRRPGVHVGRRRASTPARCGTVATSLPTSGSRCSSRSPRSPLRPASTSRRRRRWRRRSS